MELMFVVYLDNHTVVCCKRLEIKDRAQIVATAMNGEIITLSPSSIVDLHIEEGFKPQL